MKIINTPDAPKYQNGLIQMIRMGKSTRNKWVNQFQAVLLLWFSLLLVCLYLFCLFVRFFVCLLLFFSFFYPQASPTDK